MVLFGFSWFAFLWIMHDGKSILSLWCQEGKQHTHRFVSVDWSHCIMLSGCWFVWRGSSCFKTVLHLHGKHICGYINSKKHTYMYLEAVMSLFLKRLCCPNVKVQYTAKNMIIKAWQLMHLHYFNSNKLIDLNFFYKLYETQVGLYKNQLILLNLKQQLNFKV